MATARVFSDIVRGLSLRYDLGPGPDIVGRLAGDRPVGAASLYALMQDGRGVFLDASPAVDATLQVLGPGAAFLFGSCIYLRPRPSTPTPHSSQSLSCHPLAGIQCLGAGDVRSVFCMTCTASTTWAPCHFVKVNVTIPAQGIGYSDHLRRLELCKRLLSPVIRLASTSSQLSPQRSGCVET
jgi:hypothetical protein